MSVTFTKMHGLGNDFVIIEDLDSALTLTPQTVRRLCNRHLGIGADGLILVQRDPNDDPYMHYQNADGSIAEMCGNGIRCFVKYLVDTGLVVDSPVTVQTLGGPRPVVFDLDDDGRFVLATVDMGIPILDPADIPADLEGDLIVEAPLKTDIGTFTITAVSMGNPHIVLWHDDSPLDTAPVNTLGPIIECHPAFPEKTNVEFAQVTDAKHLRLRVWERGVGETLACGTGACATLVAAVLGCRTEREVEIELPGGTLAIRWDEDEHVYMTGPATTVYTGEIAL